MSDSTKPEKSSFERLKEIPVEKWRGPETPEHRQTVRDILGIDADDLTVADKFHFARLKSTETNQSHAVPLYTATPPPGETFDAAVDSIDKALKSFSQAPLEAYWKSYMARPAPTPVATPVINLDFEPGDKVRRIAYDAGGAQLDTPEQTVHATSSRHAWITVTGSPRAYTNAEFEHAPGSAKAAYIDKLRATGPDYTKMFAQAAAAQTARDNTRAFWLEHFGEAPQPQSARDAVWDRINRVDEKSSELERWSAINQAAPSSTGANAVTGPKPAPAAAFEAAALRQEQRVQTVDQIDAFTRLWQGRASQEKTADKAVPAKDADLDR